MLRPQHGFSLVELMIAALLALIALGALLTVYDTTLRDSLRQLRQARLQQSLRAVLDLAGADLRRAGFRRFDPLTDRPLDNPFQAGANDLRIGAAAGEAAASCITYSYDLDRDGRLGTGRCPRRGCAPGTDADNDERFGLRLRRGTVQMRYGGRDLDCRRGRWQSLTDPDVEITSLRFKLVSRCLALPAGGPCTAARARLLVRQVEIRVGGRLAADPGLAARLQRRVWLRNDRYLPAQAPP